MPPVWQWHSARGRLICQVWHLNQDRSAAKALPIFPAFSADLHQPSEVAASWRSQNLRFVNATNLRFQAGTPFDGMISIWNEQTPIKSNNKSISPRHFAWIHILCKSRPAMRMPGPSITNISPNHVSLRFPSLIFPRPAIPRSSPKQFPSQLEQHEGSANTPRRKHPTTCWHLRIVA